MVYFESPATFRYRTDHIQITEEKTRKLPSTKAHHSWRPLTDPNHTCTFCTQSVYSNTTIAYTKHPGSTIAPTR